MSSLTKFFSIFSVFIIAACSFSSVHQQGGTAATGALANITIGNIASDDDQKRYAQQLKSELEDSFNPTNAQTDNRYTLSVALGRTRAGQLVQNDREVTRYQLVVTGAYTLVDNTTQAIVGEGNTRVIGSFDAVVSDYATYAAEEDTMQRLTRELANNIRLRTINHLQ